MIQRPDFIGDMDLTYFNYVCNAIEKYCTIQLMIEYNLVEFSELLFE